MLNYFVPGETGFCDTPVTSGIMQLTTSKATAAKKEKQAASQSERRASSKQQEGCRKLMGAMRMNRMLGKLCERQASNAALQSNADSSVNADRGRVIVASRTNVNEVRK